MITIKEIIAREILDSRGVPTIETKIILSDDSIVIASVPSGESRGKYEGKELRDNDEKRYNGYGVLIAVGYINNLIGPKLKGADPINSRNIDYWLVHADGTPNYSKLGVNTLMSVSMAIHKAAARVLNKPLYKYFEFLYQSNYDTNHVIQRIPTPIFNVINGGKHGNKNLDFQEYQIIPSTAMTYSKTLELGAEMYAKLKNFLIYRDVGVSVSDEGGFTPELLSNIDTFEFIKQTILQTGFKLGIDVFMGVDFASGDYYKSGRYQIKDKPNSLKTDEYLDFIQKAVSAYNIIVLEDVLDDTDENGWKKCYSMFEHSSYVVGDDYLGGNRERLIISLKNKTVSGILLKLNQTGTISELIDLFSIAKKGGIKVIVSHRLGETNDDLIADLSVGLQADFVKFGSPARGERVSKYNRLLDIYSQLSVP